MTLTPLDFLFVVLAICIFILTIFLSMLLANLTALIKDSRRVVTKAEDVVEQVNTYLIIPAKIFGQVQGILEKVKDKYSNER